MQNHSLTQAFVAATNHKTLHVLSVLFDTIIAHQDISAFRGALAERVGLEHEWFHNHNNAEDGHRFHYRYPLVQYKRREQQPELIALGQGVEAAKMFFESLQWDMQMKGRLRKMDIEELTLRKYELKIVEEPIYTYRIHDWQALNQKNYDAYKGMEGLFEMIRFLEPILVAHILSFCKGIRWFVDKEIKLEITEMYPSNHAHYKGISPVLFSFAFRTNVLLPNRIGLGKGASQGFGIIRKLRTRERRNS